MAIFNGTDARDVFLRGEEDEAGELLDLTGDDLIHGFGGNDSLGGDLGSDIIYGGDGADGIYGDEPYDAFDEASDAAGGGNDTLYGEGGNDAIAGGVGRDIIDGGAGDDLIEGDGVYWLSDRFAYPIGTDDVIRGGSGNDRIEGGLGADTMYGGTGADTFVYRHFFKESFEGHGEDVFDTLVGEGGRDVIKDFEVGVDKISFEPYFNDLDITLAQYKPGWTMIKIDMDGDSRTDAQIQVYTGSGALSFDDILL